jgi:type IV pilus assembly protein PilQ
VLLRDSSGDAVEHLVPAAPEQAEGPTPSLASRYASRSLGESPAPMRSHGRTIDLDVRDADIHDVCHLLADVGHANIVVSDAVHGSVTVRMRKVPWDEALEVIAMSKGLRTVRQADVIVVEPNAK